MKFGQIHRGEISNCSPHAGQFFSYGLANFCFIVNFGAVAVRFRVTARCLTKEGGYGLEPRNVAMWIVAERCGMTLR
jgi:hypothetical protein